MMRFIDLGDQILEGTREFAWFDTVTDTFERFDGEETWDTWNEFAKCFRHDEYKLIMANLQSTKPLGRYKALFPKEWP